MPLRALRSHPSPLYRLPGTALVLIACILAMLLTIGLSSIFAWRDREATFRHATDIAGNVGLLVAEHAARLVETSDLILRQTIQLAGPPDAPLPTDRATWERITALIPTTPYLTSVWLIGPDGGVAMSTRQFPPPNINVADRDYFQAIKVGEERVISAVDDNRYSGGPLIVLLRPLPAPSGQFRGAAAVAVSPRYVRDIYQSFDIGYARSITLRKADGTILLRETEGTAGASADRGDGTAIAVQWPVDDTGLSAEVAIPRASIVEHWRKRLWAYASYSLAAVAMVTVIGALAIQRARREREAEDALQHAYDTLEERVHRRTAELERTNAQLEAALTDKEVLLKEVQHRVKNNLQVISSLLRLQAARIDEKARRGFDESLRRIQSMSLLHELLYRSDQPARIDFATYLRQLCDGLVRSGNPTGARLTIETQPWTVDVDQATPLALIASELVSNALLHAFPNGHPGTVSVELLPDAEGMRMTVRDDGVGLPPGVPSPQRRSGGLGLVLVQALTQQAGATLHIDRGSGERGNGTAFTVSIPANGARHSKAA
ncbi:sensor histidine kinase [Azospirillum soli]|uniref:sensor histidine kinase n=1 Tax=Azospirillum soli TaxID=1304799 RepID=UPI001AE2D1D6|nr:sensor histidine kinase [Azospirillum soli]MBP2313653.1 two-component sensor histidine kinase [Azospirillum soli]